MASRGFFVRNRNEKKTMGVKKTSILRVDSVVMKHVAWGILCIGVSFVYYMISHRGLIPAIGGGDSFVQNFPLRLFYAAEGIKSVFSWIPYEFLGIPFLGILHAGLLYPFNFLFFVIPPIWAFTVNDIIHPAFAAFFTFSYTRFIGIRTFPAFLSGIVFGFSGFIMAHKGHTSTVNAAVWLPLLFLIYEKIRREVHIKYALWASMIIAIQIFAGHYQICVYTYFSLAFFAFYFSSETEKALRVKYFCLCFLPIVLGSIIALPQIAATKELSDLAWRVKNDYRFFVEYSFAPFMLAHLVFPFLFGGAYGGAYWGAWNLTEMASFMGSLPLVLGVWAGAKLWKQSAYIKFFSLLSLLAFLLALGGYNPLYKIMYYVPVYNLFRCPARHWLEFNFAMSLLFGFCMDGILYSRYKVNPREILLLIAITLVAALMTISMWNSLIDSRLLDPREKVLLAGSITFRNPAVLIPLIFLSFYVVWFYIFCRKFPISGKFRNILLVLLVITILAEEFSFGGFHDAYYAGKKEVDQQLASPLLNFLKEYIGNERALFLTTHPLPLYNIPARIHTINGYDPLIPKSIWDFLDMSPGGVSSNWKGLVQNNLIISTLSTRYVIIPKAELPKYNIEELKSSKEPLLVMDVLLKDWNAGNARKVQIGEFSLSSPDGLSVSMLRQTVSLRPNTYYLLSLEARSTGRQPTAPLAFDLYAPSYDFPEQELDVDAKEIGDEYRTFSRVINTGDNLPPTVDLRVFTFSKEPIIVRRIEVKELRNFAPPYIAGEDTPDKKGMPLYERVFETPEWVVYENKNCLPRAFSVTRLEVARDIKEVKRRFETLSVNPAETAFVSQEDLNKIGRTHFAKGNVRIDSYDTDRIVIKAEFANDAGFLVLSDQYFPGWKAFIDGKDVPIYQVNGLIRGVVVPEGTHKVEFVYRPVKLYISTVIGVTAFIACLVGACWIGRKKIN